MRRCAYPEYFNPQYERQNGDGDHNYIQYIFHQWRYEESAEIAPPKALEMQRLQEELAEIYRASERAEDERRRKERAPLFVARRRV